MVEGYPVEPKPEKDIPPAFAWTGIPKAFIRAGFKGVKRASPTRPNEDGIELVLSHRLTQTCADNLVCIMKYLV